MTGKTIPVLLLILSLTACATVTPPVLNGDGLKSVPSNMAANTTPAWRICFFRITWPEGEDPAWAVDLLLAHQIIGPVLADLGPDIQSWRFHRRAARDNVGHQFRFLFYSDSTLAAEIINRIQQDPIRAQLLERQILQSVQCQSPNDMSQSGIGDTSDPNWPETVQNHWPAYIMGISQFWLGLIDDAITELGPPATDVDNLLEQYQQADETVTTHWHVEGEHALLHHLNAIFGYQPIHITF